MRSTGGGSALALVLVLAGCLQADLPTLANERRIPLESVAPGWMREAHVTATANDHLNGVTVPPYLAEATRVEVRAQGFPDPPVGLAYAVWLTPDSRATVLLGTLQRTSPGDWKLEAEIRPSFSIAGLVLDLARDPPQARGVATHVGYAYGGLLSAETSLLRFYFHYYHKGAHVTVTPEPDGWVLRLNATPPRAYPCTAPNVKSCAPPMVDLSLCAWAMPHPASDALASPLGCASASHGLSAPIKTDWTGHPHRVFVTFEAPGGRVPLQPSPFLAFDEVLCADPRGVPTDACGVELYAAGHQFSTPTP